MAELNTTMARGNHPLSTERLDILEEKLKRDVKFGFSVLVWALSLRGIPGTMVQACGLVVQQALEGIKNRLTHDLSFFITSKDASDNNRCDIAAYPEMVYGFCLSCTIHFIVALRRNFLDERIFISKYNFSDAYRRMAHRSSCAIQTILIHGTRAHIYLGLTFGASANPAVFCGLSKMLSDLSNEITLVGDWDPDIVSSPIQPKVLAAVYVESLISIAPAREMAVEVPTTSMGRDDCFLDAIIYIFLNRLTIIKRNTASVPLAMHV